MIEATKCGCFAFFPSYDLSVNIKEVLLHRFHGIRFKVSEDWLSRDNQFFFIMIFYETKATANSIAYKALLPQ